MFKLGGLKVKAIIMGVIALLIYFGYLYIVNLQEDNARLTGEVTKLEISNKSLEGQKKQLVLDIKTNIQNQDILYIELSKARESKDKLVKLFGDHDFAKLIAKKPTLMQKKMNRATKKLFKEIENETSK